MKTSGIQRALDFFEGSPTRMAAAMGGEVKRQNVEYWLSIGVVPPQHCQQVRELTGVPVWELQPIEWSRIWPMLIGTKGAPKVAEPAKAGA